MELIRARAKEKKPTCELLFAAIEHLETLS
jgi:hypothetical protein